MQVRNNFNSHYTKQKRDQYRLDELGRAGWYEEHLRMFPDPTPLQTWRGELGSDNIVQPMGKRTYNRLMHNACSTADDAFDPSAAAF